MNYEISVDASKSTIYICYKGIVSIETWVKVSDAVAKLEGGTVLRKVRYMVADFTDATLAEFNSADLTGKSVDLILKNAEINPHVTLVVIAPESLEYGLMRMLQSSLDGKSNWTSHLVKSRDECEDLLAKI